MIIGTYRFYMDGELITEQNNAITVVGRSIAIKSLLGIIPSFAGTLAYGVSNRPNSIDSSTRLITDNSLQFELGRAAVVGSSLDISENNDILVYTATVNDPYQYSIHEVGLFPSGIRNASIGLAGSLIFDFDRVDLFNKFGTASASSLVESIEARIGNQLFNLVPTDGTDSFLTYAANDNTLSEIDRYVSQDTFRLAGFDINNTAASVNFTFYTDVNNYYNFVFPTPSASGYFISEIEKGAAGIVGQPSWKTITSVKMWQNSASSIYLDALKIDFGPYLLDTVTGMISRAVLPSPIRKPSGIPLTIEYSLALDFNHGVS
jgi:hypothetical protein